VRLIIPLVAVCIVLSGCRRDPLSSAPRLLLRTSAAAEDFRFLPVAEAGVALEAATARLAGGEVDFQPRSQPVLLPEGKPYLVAVFAVSCADASISASQRARLSEAIARHANQHFFRVAQVDFAASAPQRASYREFLGELRAKLRNHQLLSVAVPAGWCRETGWVESLGVDEVVPSLEAGEELPADGPCRFSAGISSKQERIPLGFRLYARNDSPWDNRSFAALRGRIGAR